MAIGEIRYHMGDTVPEHHVLCDGSSTDPYPSLKELIGNNLPNLLDRVIMGGTTVGTIGGEAEVTLTVNQMPAHLHNTTTYQEPYQSKVFNPTTGNKVYITRKTSFNSSYTGGAVPHSNMQPYMTAIPVIQYE